MTTFPWLQVLGLFIVVSSVTALCKAANFSDTAVMVGAIVGAGTYVLLQP